MFKRSPLLATALAPVLALAACGPGTENRGLESIHQPVVERSDYVFDVNAGPRGLAPGEAERLAGWFATLRLGYGDRVAVDDPAGGALQLRSDVAGQVARYGLLLADEAPVTAEPIAPGTARIVVSRMRASVPGCPDFSRYRGTEFESNTNSNYGCAMNANLAAMVANPADLVRGEPGANVYDAAQGSKAIVIYRNATPSGGGGTVKADAGGGK
jgi:pilus assembly protein CpaD